LRREGSHLYGLVITGAVLATVDPGFRLVRVAFVLLSTLAIYWAAETFVHWTTARTLLKRDLTKAERRSVMADGWPLVAASGIPLLILGIEAVLRVETPRALQVALGLNVVLLLGIGYQMGKAGGLRGISLMLAAALTGFLGLAMILLKSTLH
jgi:hypothetical protein